MKHRPTWWAVAPLLLALAACSTSAEDERTEQRLAEELVSSTQAVGILPKLNSDVAASLYGTDASAVCDAFDGGLSTSAANRLLGNPGHGRRNHITDTAVTYAGLVIETYCPAVLPDFEDAVKDVDPVEVNK